MRRRAKPKKRKNKKTTTASSSKQEAIGTAGSESNNSSQPSVHGSPSPTTNSTNPSTLPSTSQGTASSRPKVQRKKAKRRSSKKNQSDQIKSDFSFNLNAGYVEAQVATDDQYRAQAANFQRASQHQKRMMSSSSPLQQRNFNSPSTTTTRTTGNSVNTKSPNRRSGSKSKRSAKGKRFTRATASSQTSAAKVRPLESDIPVTLPPGQIKDSTSYLQDVQSRSLFAPVGLEKTLSNHRTDDLTMLDIHNEICSKQNKQQNTNKANNPAMSTTRMLFKLPKTLPYRNLYDSLKRKKQAAQKAGMHYRRGAMDALSDSDNSKTNALNEGSSTGGMMSQNPNLSYRNMDAEPFEATEAGMATASMTKPFENAYGILDNLPNGLFAKLEIRASGKAELVIRAKKGHTYPLRENQGIETLGKQQKTRTPSAIMHGNHSGLRGGNRGGNLGEQKDMIGGKASSGDMLNNEYPTEEDDTSGDGAHGEIRFAVQSVKPLYNHTEALIIEAPNTKKEQQVIGNNDAMQIDQENTNANEQEVEKKNYQASYMGRVDYEVVIVPSCLENL
eukprot:g2986.t1